MPDPDYRVVVNVGAHSYDGTYGDEPTYGVALPLTVGWQIPEATEFYPSQADPTSGSFGLVAESVADLDDLAIGDPVSVAMYVIVAKTDESMKSRNGVSRTITANDPRSGGPFGAYAPPRGM